MVDNVTVQQQDAYIRAYIERLPELERGETHTIRRGESLWNISKSKLGTNPKNAQIQDYMYSIAKLNGLDSVQKLNSLKINDVIYLPKDYPSSNTSQNNTPPATGSNSPTRPNTPVTTPSQPVRNNPPETGSNSSTRPTAPITTPSQPVRNNPPAIGSNSPTRPNTPVTTPSQPVRNTPPATGNNTPQRTQAERCFSTRLNTVLTNNRVSVVRGPFTTIFGNTIYHVELRSNSINNYNRSNVMSFTMNRNTNKIVDIMFEDDRNLNPDGYDYKIGIDNVIKSNKSYPVTSYGQITQQQRQILENKLKSMIQ